MNMREVARRAGVSSATVSRVINGSPLVEEQTARRVQQVLDEVQFIPNPVATTLKYGRSRTYGLLIPDITNPFYPEFLREFEKLLVETDHEVLLASISGGDAALVHSVRRMLMRQVDGVVLMASEFDTKAIEPLLARKVPLVTVDRRAVQEGVSDVAIDFESGLNAAVAHLRELGHTELAFVGATHGLRTSKIRTKAYQQALKRHGLSFFPDLVVEGNYRVDGGELAVERLLAQKHRPTAILTVNDLTAFGVIRGLHRAGVGVPKDISVIGMDDIFFCDLMDPPLTTVHTSRREMASSCIQALEFTKAHPHEPGRKYRVASQLTLRESTAEPPHQMRSSASA